MCKMIVAYLLTNGDFLSLHYREEPLLRGSLYRHLNEGPIPPPGWSSATLVIRSALPDVAETPEELRLRMNVWANEGKA